MAVNRDLSSHDSRVHIYPTDNEAFVATTAAITELVRLGISKNQTSNVILAAGNSISKTLSLLSSFDTDWSKVNWYLADERYVDAESDLRNDKQITEVLRSSLGVHYGQIFSPSSYLAHKEAADEYASRIGQVNMFDFCLLGMGNDGHVASLLPNHQALNSDRICCEIIDSPNPPTQRITLTLKAFAQVENRILITTGSNKSDAVAEFTTNPKSPVRLYNPTAIFADQAAYS
ncbi:MAG: 6-phosphogluconolactonase [Acidimicrobiaceae bacterium]